MEVRKGFAELRLFTSRMLLATACVSQHVWLVALILAPLTLVAETVRYPQPVLQTGETGIAMSMDVSSSGTLVATANDHRISLSTTHTNGSNEICLATPTVSRLYRSDTMEKRLRLDPEMGNSRPGIHIRAR